MVLEPLIIVPLSGNPTVESTVITDAPTETLLIDLVDGVTTKFPWIVGTSSYPTNKNNL